MAPGGFTFRPSGNASRLGDAVRFGWEMVSAGGEVAGVGLELVVLGPDGRIRLDYRFIES